MQKFTDLVLGQNGQAITPIIGASVAVYTYPGNVLAPLFSDNGVTATANPLTTDQNGRFSFYAANGRYSMVVSYLNVSYTLQDVPLEDDPATPQPIVATTLQVTDTTNSTSPTTGAETIAGGLGVVGDVWSGAAFHGAFAGPLNGTVGATTPSTGAFTSLSSTSGALNGSLGATTPSSVAATTVSASGTITPSQTNGIVGTTTNNNANAGSFGEFVTSTSGVASITSGTPTNITSISLTAGDWDVQGNIVYLPQAGATLTIVIAAINTTSATLPAQPNYTFGGGISVTSGSGASALAPVQRISLSATTTVFLVGQTSSSGGTVNSQGFIRARRIR